MIMKHGTKARRNDYLDEILLDKIIPPPNKKEPAVI